MGRSPESTLAGAGRDSERGAETDGRQKKFKGEKVVLVNIFGGIVRCDLIAEGILAAIEEIRVSIPVVVRLEGNKADIGSDILAESNAEIVSVNNLEDATKKAVELSQ